MKLLTRRHEVVRAERRLRSERGVWLVQTQALRRSISRHRAEWIIGGGVGVGLLAGSLPLRGAVRVGALLARLAGFALRLPIGTLLLERAAQPVQTAPPMQPTDMSQ